MFKNMLSYWNSGYSFLKGILIKDAVLYVQFVVTNRCNLNCRMCGSSISRSGEREMSLPEIDSLSRVLGRIKAAFVVLTGGEPFLRDDLEEIVRIFSRKGIMVRLQTNATLITRGRISRLAAAGLSGLTVSLDTLDCQRQERINGQKGSWVKAIEGLSLVSQEMPDQSLIGVNTVISKFNIDEALDMARFVDKLGFYISLIPLHTAQKEGSGFFVRKNSPEMQFGESDFPLIDSVFGSLIKMKRNGCRIYNSARFLKETPDFLKYGKTSWRCLSPRLYFAVSSSGKFLPCIDTPYPGQVAIDKDFPVILRSKRFREEAGNFVKKCSGCMYPCWPEVSYICCSPSVLWERIIFGLKSFSRGRKKLSLEDIYSFIPSR